MNTLNTQLEDAAFEKVATDLCAAIESVNSLYSAQGMIKLAAENEEEEEEKGKNKFLATKILTALGGGAGALTGLSANRHAGPFMSGGDKLAVLLGSTLSGAASGAMGGLGVDFLRGGVNYFGNNA